jgi:hypothetical protein
LDRYFLPIPEVKWNIGFSIRLIFIGPCSIPAGINAKKLLSMVFFLKMIQYFLYNENMHLFKEYGRSLEVLLSTVKKPRMQWYGKSLKKPT